MQPSGDSTFALISLISEVAQTVVHKKKKCESLTRRSRMIVDCLHQLHDLNLVHSPESRKLIKSLEETLCQIHTLFKTCQKTKITYHFSGGKLAGQFREVQDKIGIYLIAFPSIIQVYLACQFARVAGHGHVAAVQEQWLLSESPQRVEEGPPPPSISVAAFYFVLNKAFSYLECYGMGQGMKNLKDRLFKRMEEIQAATDRIDYLEIKAKSTAHSTWIWPLRDAFEEVEAAVDGIAYDECERAIRAQIVRHKVRSPRSSFGKGKNIRDATSLSWICMRRLRNAVLDLDEVARDAYLYFYHETRYISEKNHVPINNLPIGRVIEKKKIVCWLTQPESMRRDNGLSVFAVHGKSGMGKTTLVRLVYREEEVMESFDSMIWLNFPKNFDAGIMTQRIVESVANWRFSYDTLEDLQKILINELSTKKFLLILDGAQDGDRIDEWKRLMAPLRYGQCGSKIVLTTQELSVVNVVAELAGGKPELLPLSGLSYDESLALFRRHGLTNLDSEIYVDFSPEIFEEKISLIIRATMERFEGCPLLIKALAGYLEDNFLPKHVDEIIMLMRQNECSADCLLKLLYHGLPSHIQACFRYCSIFPREHKFKQEDLVKYWIGSGLIPEDSYANQRPEDIGKVYIDILVRKSFLDKTAEGISCAEYQEYYILPTSMHELAQHFALGECARIDSGSFQYVGESVRHLCIAQHDPLTRDSLKMLSHLKYLRTLIVEGGFKDKTTEIVFGEILKGLKFLRLLCLPRISSSSTPNEVFSLTQLRYISLLKCGRADLCKIFKLYNLRVLKLHFLLAEAMDFDGITNLVHLRYLDIPEHCHPNVRNVGYLSQLQELDNFVIRKPQGCGVSTLENLLHLRRLGLQEMENIDCQDAMNLNLKHKTELKSLALGWSRHSIDSSDDQILNNLEPPAGIEELHVMGYSGHIPVWMVEGSLLQLVFLEIKDCMRWESIPSLTPLLFLKHLRLEHLSNLRRIGDEFEVHMESDAFIGTFFPPSLEILTVELCPKLKRLPYLPLSLSQLVLDNVGLEAFPKIELIMDSQPNQSSSSLVQSNLVFLHVENCSDLATLNEGLLQQQEHLGSLQKVVFKNCENLEHLPLDGFSALVQLKHLGIISCPMLRMRRDTDDNLFPLSLKYFDIRCSDAEVSMLTSMQRNVALRRLSLFDCNNLKKLPSEGVFKALGMLDEVAIVRCKNLLSLGGLRAAESLRFLTIVCCEKLEISDAASNKESCAGCSFELDRLKISHQNLLLVEPLMKLQSTKELHICNDDRMTHLSKNWLMNNRASLRSIVIGVADSLLSLPSWLVELENLQFLHVARCFLIDSIPEMPSSLRKLTIWGCHPLLLDRCQKDIGADWSKIAKIDADLQASTVN